MFGKFKRAMLAGAIVASLVAQTVLPAMAAGTATYSFNPASLAVAEGATFSMDVQVTTSAPSTDFQFGFTFDPALLQVNSVTAGSYLQNYSSGGTSGSGSFVFNQPWSVNNTTGVVGAGAQAVLNDAGGAGVPAGTYTVATVNFTAKSAAGIATLALTDLVVTGLAVSGVNGSVTVGTPPAVDLAISNARTEAVVGDPTQYNVLFNVVNQGDLDAGVAFDVAVSIDGGANVIQPVSSLNSGAVLPMVFGPFTITGSLDNVAIVVDLNNVVAESNEANNGATTAYQYSALAADGDTPVSALLAAYLELTAPPAIEDWVLIAGQDNPRPNGSVKVKSNVDFQVFLSATNDGRLSEYDGAAFVGGGAQLINRLRIQEDALPNTVTLTGTPQLFVQAERADADPVNGISFPTKFHQFVGYNDKPVNAPNYYFSVVTFAAAGSF